jgi:glycerophosphoryl diester phosphodiesterase
MATIHPPVVIAHRGASALRPEHTLAAYALAIEQGADWIEPDLVCTRDGVLVARHENEIGGTTDVASHHGFAPRHTRKFVDGERIEGWFTEDFTLAELRTLRARERLPKLRSTAFDGHFGIATWDEIVALAAAESAARGRVIGLVPELKKPSHFRAHGLPLEERLLASLDAHDYTRHAPVIVQSFEVGNLHWLRAHLEDRRNVQLLQLLDADHEHPADDAATTYGAMATREGLRAIAQYADWVAPNSRAILPVDDRGRLGAPTAFLHDAHAAGLRVAPWTFAPENRRLPRALWLGDDPATVNHAGALAELHAFLDAGIDGFFSDDPGLGRRAVDAWLAARAEAVAR